MIPRILADYLLRDSRYYPVVTLTGPRQSGKTTLVKHVFPDYAYVTLELPEHRQFAREDPEGFLNRFGSPVIIDEVQRVPELFSMIQVSVDEDETPGRFVLTGSQNFLLLESVSQTLAGRSGVLHLLPLGRAELERQEQQPPAKATDLFCNTKTRLDLDETMFAGFYPRIHSAKIPPEVWLPDYISTYIERDVRSTVNIGDLERFERFLGLVAGRTGQILNYSSLANDAGLSVDTVRRWISVLKTSFIVLLLRPHHRNLNKRVIKSPKLYFYDTGLACRLLGIHKIGQLPTHPLRGALFENLVVAETAKAYIHHRLDPPIYFWRDKTGHEIDLVMENGADLYPVEIKSGMTIHSDMFRELRWWCDQAGQPISTATLVYGGNDSYRRSEISVRPWFSL